MIARPVDRSKLINFGWKNGSDAESSQKDLHCNYMFVCRCAVDNEGY